MKSTLILWRSLKHFQFSWDIVKIEFNRTRIINQRMPLFFSFEASKQQELAIAQLQMYFMQRSPYKLSSVLWKSTTSNRLEVRAFYRCECVLFSLLPFSSWQRFTLSFYNPNKHSNLNAFSFESSVHSNRPCIFVHFILLITKQWVCYPNETMVIID